MGFWSPRGSEPRVDARSNFFSLLFCSNPLENVCEGRIFGVPFVLQRSMFKHQSILRVRCPLSKYNYTKVLIPDGYVKLEIKRKYFEIEGERSVRAAKCLQLFGFHLSSTLRWRDLKPTLSKLLHIVQPAICIIPTLATQTQEPALK